MFLISIPALQRNAKILRDLADEAGCEVILALKGFSCWKAFPYIRDMLDGCCASGIYEARLAHEEFGKHIVTYSPAYTRQEIKELLDFSTHLDFNSLPQWYQFRSLITQHTRFRTGALKCGLRINPQHSTGSTPLYDPCSPDSRLGITADQLPGADLDGISGLHFHTLCEQGAEDLESTLTAVEQKFGDILRQPQITYLNMGGGHWITKPFYNRDLLIRLIRKIKETYTVKVWLEPGEAVAIHTGVLRANVLDVFATDGRNHAILDVSATAHMPDVIEMPYRPDLFLVEQTAQENSRLPAVVLSGETYLKAKTSGQHTYHLGGPTCLAGDVMGVYGFHRPLKAGDTLVFDDMAHYTMVKTTTFNGVKHPPIALQTENGHTEVIREFTYTDFKNRLS